MSEARQQWLMKKLALYERAKALQFRQEALTKHQNEIYNELAVLKAETEKLFREEPKE